jgi:hypothetical protein
MKGINYNWRRVEDMSFELEECEQRHWHATVVTIEEHTPCLNSTSILKAQKIRARSKATDGYLQPQELHTGITELLSTRYTLPVRALHSDIEPSFPVIPNDHIRRDQHDCSVKCLR